jgi:hypothetical protein
MVGLFHFTDEKCNLQYHNSEDSLNLYWLNILGCRELFLHANVCSPTVFVIIGSRSTWISIIFVFLLARSYPDTVPSLTYFSARDMGTLCDKCNFHHCRRSVQSIFFVRSPTILSSGVPFLHYTEVELCLSDFLSVCLPDCPSFRPLILDRTLRLNTWTFSKFMHFRYVVHRNKTREQ